MNDTTTPAVAAPDTTDTPTFDPAAETPAADEGVQSADDVAMATAVPDDDQATGSVPDAPDTTPPEAQDV